MKLLFVSDEETGSQLGVQYFVAHANLFRPTDRALVPGGGSTDGAQIEIAEKSILWLRFKVRGKQCQKEGLRCAPSYLLSRGVSETNTRAA